MMLSFANNTFATKSVICDKIFISAKDSGVTYSLGQHIFIHPGTDTYMIGYEIPFWKQTVEMLTEVAKRIPQVRFVGWDIAISSDGPVLIEGNQYPGVIFEPLSMKHGIYKEMMSYQ